LTLGRGEHSEDHDRLVDVAEHRGCADAEPDREVGVGFASSVSL
jgi:hypothetical protein